MQRSRVEPWRVASVAAAAASATGAALVGIILYAAGHPQGAPLLNDGPHPQDVLWPVLVAVLALAASVRILRRPGRLSYLASGGANVLMVSIGLTLPSWLPELGPLAALLCIIGAVGLVVSAVGWAISPPLPEVKPRWPTHHENG